MAGGGWRQDQTFTRGTAPTASPSWYGTSETPRKQHKGKSLLYVMPSALT